MSRLPADDSDVHISFREETGPRVSERMDVDPLADTPEYTVTVSNLADIGSTNSLALVACKEQSVVITGPGGYPRIELPARFPVDPNDPTLATLSFEYSNGLSFRVDVRNSKAQHLRAAELAAKGEGEDQAVPPARSGAREAAEKVADFVTRKNLWRK